MRLTAAIGVIAVTLAAAVYVHQRHVLVTSKHECASVPTQGARLECVATWGTSVQAPYVTHPTWEDPVAVLLALGGVAVAVGIVATGPRYFAKPS